jgi:hypothetical protein
MEYAINHFILNHRLFFKYMRICLFFILFLFLSRGANHFKFCYSKKKEKVGVTWLNLFIIIVNDVNFLFQTKYACNVYSLFFYYFFHDD